MKYENKELISALAAEYVLGTLRGAARDRFDALKAKRKDFQTAVYYWESELNVMANHIEPVEPRPEVWQVISQRIGINNEDNVVDLNRSKHDINQNQSQQRQKSSIWQWVSGVAVAASIVMAVILLRPEIIDETDVSAVVVFNNEASEVLWTIDIQDEQLIAKATRGLRKRPNNDYELWIVPKSGDAPISLGLLPQSGMKSISTRLPLRFDEIGALAVSLEPVGGSPTGAPSEVLYAAQASLLDV